MTVLVVGVRRDMGYLRSRQQREYLRQKWVASDIVPCVEDAVDQRIVAEVSRDGRATLADLSAAVGLSVSAVQARLKRLETRGVITGYRAVVDPEAVGRPLAAFIEITPLDPAQPDNAPELLAQPGRSWCVATRPTAPARWPRPA